MVLLVFRLESKNTDGQTLCRRYEDGSREPEFVTMETEIAVGFFRPTNCVAEARTPAG